MDLDSLKTQVANLTLYDIKAGVRKVQNAVMNYTEMESKVREATNNDPWGAPSSLMQEIANGTHSYQQLNEIMPLIYKRFTDKTSEEWRQIYKSLQLLEFLVKNGSERVIDDARSHLSLLRMLKQFHFIDQNGKDQGVNVRNRAQELSKLLGDVDAIRAERKKARSNRNKYGGVEGGGGLGSGISSSNQYGGFGSDEPAGYGGYQGEVYGDGGGFGGRDTNFSDTQRRTDKFEEYDEADDGSAPARTTRSTKKPSTSTSTPSRAAQKAKAREPEPDLLGFDDESAVISPTNGKVPVTSGNNLDDFGATQAAAAGDDDDFDDFQSATTPSTWQPPTSGLSSLSPAPQTTSTTTSSTQFAAPKPLPAHQAANYTNIFSTTSPGPQITPSANPPSTSTLSSLLPQAQAVPKPYKPSGPNYFTSVPIVAGASPSITTSANSASAFSPRPSSNSTTAANLGRPVPKPAAAGAADAFSSLWSTASSKAGIQNKADQQKGPDLASMAKAKSEAGIWGMASAPQAGQRSGAQAPTPNTAAQQGGGSALDDLLG